MIHTSAHIYSRSFGILDQTRDTYMYDVCILDKLRQSIFFQIGPLIGILYSCTLAI